MKSKVFWRWTLRNRDRTRPRLGIWKPIWWVTTRQLAFWSLFSLLTFLNFEGEVSFLWCLELKLRQKERFFSYLLKTREGGAFCVFGARLLNFVSFSRIQICSFISSMRLSQMVLVLCSNWWLPCGNRAIPVYTCHVHVRFAEKRKLLPRVPTRELGMYVIDNGMCLFWCMWVDCFNKKMILAGWYLDKFLKKYLWL